MNTQSTDIDALASEIITRIHALPSLKTEPVRVVRREYSKRLAHTSPQLMIALALHLLDYSDTVFRILAYELLHHHHATLASLGEGELEQLGHGIDSWEDVDTFACYLSGPAWREHQVPDTLLYRWVHSEDRWWRRAALVSTVPLNTRARGGRGDTVRTLQICRLLITDRDDMIVKALSWALRELCTHDPQAVRAFLAEHQGKLAPRVVREVQNKLTTGLKNPRKR